MRVRGGELGQYPRQERGADAGCRDDGDGAGRPGPASPTAECAASTAAQDVAGVAQQHLALVGERHRPAAPVEQGRADRPFESGDVRADPRLGPVHLTGRRREPAPFHHGQEGAQPFKLHTNRW
jgi:hypothetical protein